MDEVLSVARQPILDSRNGVYGYELLYRSAGRSLVFGETVASLGAHPV